MKKFKYFSLIALESMVRIISYKIGLRKQLLTSLNLGHTVEVGGDLKVKSLHMLTFVLVVVGALNWGLSALGFNVVELLLGAGSTLTRVVYLLVGASGVYLLVSHKGDCKACMGK